MNISPIRGHDDYLRALNRVSELMDAQPVEGSAEFDELDVLATLVDAYEEKVFPIGPADPIEALKFRMEQAGLSAKDLVPLIGNSNRVYEVLSGKRALTLRMIRNIHRDLGVPAEALIA